MKIYQNFNKNFPIEQKINISTFSMKMTYTMRNKLSFTRTLNQTYIIKRAKHCQIAEYKKHLKIYKINKNRFNSNSYNIKVLQKKINQLQTKTHMSHSVINLERIGTKKRNIDIINLFKITKDRNIEDIS